MGIQLVDAVSMIRVLQELKKTTCKRLKVCSIGYPDLIFNIPDLAKALAALDFDVSALRGLKETPYKSDFMSQASSETYIDPKSLFRALGFSLDVLDIVSHRGVEILVDLNQPGATRKMAERYDFVIDNGSLEHCFNVGEALINVARLVARNGFVMHMNPLLMINHGFYNLCPTLLCDFYDQNGFCRTELYARGVVSGKKFEIYPFKRFRINGEELSMTFFARREKFRSSVLGIFGQRKFSYPTQSKYKLLMSRAKTD